MKVLHYYTGITISLFVGFHLMNHLMILRSEETHLRFMNQIRKIYRHPLIETILLMAVLSQVITGPFLAVAKWGKATEFFEWLQIFSGLYLSLFLINHVRAVMVGRYKLHIDTNLYYGAGVMNLWPQKLFFIPYYFFAVLSFFSHVASIHRFKIESLVGESAAKTQGCIIVLLGIILSALLIARMSNLKNFHLDVEKYHSKHK